jgi:DNA-binding SARP family transcriptional activator
MDRAGGAGTSEPEIRLLGPIEVARSAGRVVLGGQKPRALLAVLALEAGRVVSVDRLVEALWPADQPETAAHAVQVYVSQLRKALGPVIATHAPGYTLELELERVDVHRFTRMAQEGSAALAGGDAAAAESVLREALGLWRGPVLADFIYEPFAQAEIARVEELHTVVLEERIAADLELGRHADLVSELEALVQAQPLRERPRAQLMLALYRSGRQADALAVYRSAWETLVEQLGIDPGPELRKLEAAILRQDDSLLLDDTRPARPTMQFRRLAAILFVDIVDSMALGEMLDPESVASIHSRYFDSVSAAITRHGGTVEKYAGDAVMAAFGVPICHEDDALRAARAAVDIGVGIAALNDRLSVEHGVKLEIRIGIAAGEVVASSAQGNRRFVAGNPVAIAAHLQQRAQPGEIVVGEVVARLIDHAARLTPCGELEIPGRQEPFAMFLLDELATAAPAFEQRLDAPLAGRKRELAALRRSLKRAVDSQSARVALVVASPGVGKSRLAAELTRRTRGVIALGGRCVSYGDGITYWPLHEALADAPECDERTTVLAALAADPSPPAPEIAWLFRLFCEAVARVRPLILVIDDVQWAEPTLLELVEHLAEKGKGAILVVCLAREELTEDQPSFLEGLTNVDSVRLDVLSGDETDGLLDGLGGVVLESDQRTRIVEAAEGNPLFLEQLLAFALEGGLLEEQLPETIQVLLATRLDRLGPGERAVLERGAVVGKEFTASDVLALLEPDVAATADAHLAVLVRRGFVRPGGGDVFGFRHGLVQEAAYRAAPKRLRADLHERYADRLDQDLSGVPELDEFAGYHLERAYRLRAELGETDRKMLQLGDDAARRLGAAGVRAAKRGDSPAAVSLLRRAAGVPTLPDVVTAELRTELGLVLRVGGEFEESTRVLDHAVEAALRSGDRRVELRARMERAVSRVTFLSEVGDELIDVTKRAIPVFEAAGDDRALGRALILAGWMEGGHRGRHAVRLAAAEQALVHYRRTTWPVSPAVGEIASALYFGPTPVAKAIERLDELARTEDLDRTGLANVRLSMGGLVAQEDDFDRARSLIGSARDTYEDLGQWSFAVVHGATILGDVERLSGDLAAAERTLRSLCAELERRQAYSHLASGAGDLAETLYRLGRLDEAFEWVEVAEGHSANDDFDALVLWMPVRAKLLARTGEIAEATSLAREAVDLAQEGDALNRTAKAMLDLGEILVHSGRLERAQSSFAAAAQLYELKGNVVGERRARALLDHPALVVGAARPA